MLPLHVSKKKMLFSIGTCQVTDLPTFNESFSRTSFFSGMFQGSSGPYKTSLEQKLFQTWQSLFIPFPFKKNMLSKKQMCKISTALGSVFWCSWIGFFLLPPHGPHGQHLSKSSVRLLRETTEVNFPPSNVLSIPWSVLRIDVLASKTKPQKRILAGALATIFVCFGRGIRARG